MHANVVYNEYIGDKEHLHMNATKWETLTGFVKYLGREGYCTVEETPKGWYITYIDRDPKTLAKQEALARKERMALTDEELTAKMIEEQIERAKKAERAVEEAQATELKRDDPEDKVQLALKPVAKDVKIAPTANGGFLKTLKPSPLATAGRAQKELANGYGASDNRCSCAFGMAMILYVREGKGMRRILCARLQGTHVQALRLCVCRQKRKSNLEMIMEMEQQKKKAKARKEHWVASDIVVKVLNKRVGDGRYYKEKGVIVRVHDLYLTEVEMLASGDVLKLDQQDLETVIPKIGGRVLVVNGVYDGSTGRLDKIITDKFCASILLDSGPDAGKVVELPYEDFSKYSPA